MRPTRLALVAALALSLNPIESSAQSIQRLKQSTMRLAQGSVVPLPTRIGNKSAQWSSSNTIVLYVAASTARAVSPGTAWLRVVYGELRDSVLVTVVSAPLAAPANLVPTLARLSYSDLGLDVTWSAVAGASGYQWRAFYLADSLTAVRTTVLTSPAAIKLPRRIAQTYRVCVRAAGAGTIVGPETCLNQLVADIDRISVQLDSASMAVGSQSMVCAYAWFQNRVVRNQPITLTSSNTAIATVTPVPDDTPCLAKLAPAQIWPLP